MLLEFLILTGVVTKREVSDYKIGDFVLFPYYNNLNEYCRLNNVNIFLDALKEEKIEPFKVTILLTNMKNGLLEFKDALTH